MCIFLPIDITIVHIVTNEHYEMHKQTQKQGNKSKSKPVFPFRPCLYSGRGHIPSSLSCVQAPLLSVMHFSSTPKHTATLISPILTLKFAVFLASIDETSHTT